MKKLLTIALAIGMVITVSAQRGKFGGSRIVIISPTIGFGYGYSPFYYSPFAYRYGNPYGYGYYSPYRTSSKLQAEIDGIKTDYADKIHSAKKDKNLGKEERAGIIKQLKTERDQAVKDVKANYYKPKKPAVPETDSNG